MIGEIIGHIAKMPTEELVGQIISIIATILMAISYQANTKRSILIIQTAAVIGLCSSYLLLGAISGFALNVVCLIRNGVFYFLREGSPLHRILTAVLMVALIAVGILTWEDIMSLFILVALVLNTHFMSLGKPQVLRFSILLTSSLILIYAIDATSIGGIMTEALSIGSAIVGIVRFLHPRATSCEVADAENAPQAEETTV
ncbi:MAG: YgjV family protein [Clostridia bacterium]|nr:YgjV family protein [Clostridia bacterium]